MGFQRRIAAALGLARLQRVAAGRLAIGMRFNAIGIGGSRLARRINKMNMKVARITAGQQRIQF